MQYEIAVVKALSGLRCVGIRSLILENCGGVADAGVDFLGRWTMDDGRATVAVVGQCKDEGRKCTTRHLRELEGVLSGRADPTVGFLVHSKGFTSHTMQALHATVHPLVCVTLRKDADTPNEIVMSAAVAKLVPGLVIGTTLNSNAARRPCFVWTQQ